MKDVEREGPETMAEIVSIVRRKMLVIHAPSADNASGPSSFPHARRTSSQKISDHMGTLRDRLDPEKCEGVRRSETLETLVFD